jgi:hypothetical protein
MTESAAAPDLSVAYVVTADDLLATNRIGERDGRPMLFVTAAVLVLLGVLLWQLSPLLGGAIAAVGIAAASLVFVPALWRVWIARQAGNLIGERRQFAFDEEGVHEESAGIRHTLPWSTFTHLRVDRGIVMLARNGRLVLAIPARAFASPDDVQRLIGLASAHASHVKITWDR